jgi:site-specific DNA-methyltransferase (adenine-specific)
MGAIIWQKPTTMNTTGGASVMGSFPYPRNGIIKIDYEFILVFKKPGEAPKVSKELKEKSKLSKEEWNEYFNGHWNFNGERQTEHLAMFPEELPKRLIKMFSFVGDTVLDPFLGSGTTMLAAKNLGRNSIGYEINPDFLNIIKKKIGIDETKLFENHKFEILKQESLDIDWEEEIKNLPYRFIDPIKFDRKMDPKKLRFGSKIDFSETNKEEFFTIKEIISPEELMLSNNLKIKLIGIKAKKESFEVAITFLRKKLKGQKVYLKYDNIKYDTNNNLLAYLYLKNKTFINAHLLKTGLVEVDDSFDYMYKEKFINLKGIDYA